MDLSDTLAHYDALADALPAEDRAAVAQALEQSPALREAFARWQSLRAAVRADLGRALPDRALLVLYALRDDDLLDADEQRRLDAAAPALRDAVERHPGLAAAVERIRADRDAFDAAWAGALAATPERTGPRPAAPADRAAAAPPRRPAHRRPTRWVWRAASLAAVVAFAAVLSMLALRDQGWDTLRPDAATTVALADGSSARLAAGSVLMVPTADGARQARLMSGEALFEIEHDAAAPFHLQTANAEVTVLGTTFNVAVGEAETAVVLLDGAVELAPRERPAAAVRLAPGQRSRVVALDAPSAPAPADVGAAVAWSGRIVARGLTAEGVATRIAAATGVSVSVAGELQDEVVTGTFHAEEGAERAAETLAMALGARVEADGDGLRIAAAGE